MEEPKNKYNQKLTEEEINQLQVDGMLIGEDVVINDGAFRFSHFFREFVNMFGDNIRPYVKSIYLSLQGKLPDEVFEKMDDVDVVRAFDINIPIEEMPEKKYKLTFYPKEAKSDPLWMILTEKELKENPTLTIMTRETLDVLEKKSGLKPYSEAIAEDSGAGRENLEWQARQLLEKLEDIAELEQVDDEARMTASELENAEDDILYPKEREPWDEAL